MDNIESYLIAVFSIGICGFFSGGAQKHLELQWGNVIELTNSNLSTVATLLCGPIGLIYAILWGLAINHYNVLVMAPFFIIWFGCSTVGKNFFGQPSRWKYSIYGLFWMPLSYHLGVSYLIQQNPINF